MQKLYEKWIQLTTLHIQPFRLGQNLWRIESPQHMYYVKTNFQILLLILHSRRIDLLRKGFCPFIKLKSLHFPTFWVKIVITNYTNKRACFSSRTAKKWDTDTCSLYHAWNIHSSLFQWFTLNAILLFFYWLLKRLADALCTWFQDCCILPAFVHHALLLIVCCVLWSCNQLHVCTCQCYILHMSMLYSADMLACM